ncbi:MAG: hydantoinase/oxoprolinase family protein [Betaproteobacteria bacterium]|nr:hydantoinase/oxoprolinase family protein [Betaproteobacteria bacterium]
MTPSLCIGVDVGGTFTDAVLSDGQRVRRAKALSTPADLGQGVLAACEAVARRWQSSLGDVLPRVSRFGLGTTAVTNVLAARSGRRVGLITTRGFEALVPMARGRWAWDDGWLVPPAQIIHRRDIAGVRERIDRAGAIIEPLHEADVMAAGGRLLEQGIEAIAISFLWSFINPAHEERALELLQARFPGVPLESGAVLLPVMREYDRTTFALLNAYTSGALRGIDALADTLAERGLQVPLLLVHSGGGAISPGEAKSVPISLAESGPAAGVAAAAFVAASADIDCAVTCDMGGTTLDISVVAGGQPMRRMRGDLMGVWTALSSVDVDSVGAGGGSLAWTDALGALRVGPRSAGAVPGPACYGLGGVEPTVTDALLVLGYLDPARFLGGDMPLDTGAARDACARLGTRLGRGASEIAWGIRVVAIAEMASAIRARLAERGLDARAHAILSYGGCTGLFAAELAREIGARRVLVPELASVLSAFGAANADVRRERTRAVGVELPADPQRLQRISSELRAEVERDLANDGIAPAGRAISFVAELHIKRQKWELAIPFADARLDAAAQEKLMADFRVEYVKRYGQGALMTVAPVELVALRAIGVGRTVKASLERADAGQVPAGTPAPVSGSRRILLSHSAPAQPVNVVAWDELLPGHALAGPALVDCSDTTLWLPASAAARLDSRYNLIIEMHG